MHQSFETPATIEPWITLTLTLSSEHICMKCQILLSGEKKRKISSICRLLIYPKDVVKIKVLLELGSSCEFK